MSETLILRLSPLAQDTSSESSPDRGSWVVLDAAGTRIGEVTDGTLAEAANAAQARRLIALLPPNECLVSHSKLPLKSQQKLLQALPFSFEDSLIGNTDDMHFVAGSRDEDGRFDVAGIARERLDAYVAALAEHNMVAQQIVPCDAVVPRTEGGCTLFLEADEGILRNTNGDAISLSLDTLNEALQLIAGQRDEDAGDMPVTVFIDDSSGTAGEKLVQQVYDDFPHAEFRRLPNGALTRLATSATEAGLPSFLQGDYAAGINYEKIFAPWRMAAVAAGILCLVSIGYKAIELGTMKTRLTTLNSAMQDLAKETFPQRKNIPDPVALFRSEARKLGSTVDGGSEFIEYMGVLTSAATADTGLDMVRLTYRAGTMDLQVNAATVAKLDGFTNNVTSADGFTASLNSTKPDGDKIEGRVQIKRAQP